jgi:hypothetical protein
MSVVVPPGWASPGKKSKPFAGPPFCNHRVEQSGSQSRSPGDATLNLDDTRRVAIRGCGPGSIKCRLGLGELTFQCVDATDQIVTSLYLPLRNGPIRFGLNCVLKRFRLIIEFGDLAFNLRDVDDCRKDPSPARIGFMRRNPLFDVLGMCFRSGQVLLHNRDQANGEARIVILEPFRHLRLQRKLALDFCNSALCQFPLRFPRVHPTPHMKLSECWRAGAAMART